MKRIKSDYEITEILHNKTILDLDPNTQIGGLSPSEYLLYVKDISYLDDFYKLSLVIISKNDGYVVNNDFRFNSLEVNGNELIFLVVNKNKTNKSTKHKYWIKDE